MTSNKDFSKYYTKENIEIVETAVKSLCSRTVADYDGMLEYAMERFFNCVNNFKEELGKPFENYLKACMRGYCLNFIRDRSFLSSVKKSDLNVYTSVCRTGSVELAALSLGKTENYVQNIYDTIKLSRKACNIYTQDDTCQLKYEDRDSLNSLLQSFTDLLTDEEYTILNKYYVGGKTEQQIINSFGVKRARIIHTIKDKLYSNDVSLNSL